MVSVVVWLDHACGRREQGRSGKVVDVMVIDMGVGCGASTLTE